MALTCDRCLQGDQRRCRGKGCANYERAREVRRAPRVARPRTVKQPRPVPAPERNWKEGVHPLILEAIRQAQEEGMPNWWIQRRMAGAQAPQLPERKAINGEAA